ncbi:fucose permease [Larkinella arboricola]|uniref:Fucose permease n=1 Tax=Larkinella arboricola TaxID=643671 RepID=A0A327WY26_LARAB|nr:MFS transporter [Larkinella arboricola]RAJ94435.1 fucose permease [Larkinella arboricola]
MNVTIDEKPSAAPTLLSSLQTFFTHPHARAVGLVFTTESLLLGGWVAHIPHVKQKLHLTDAGLGMVLFAMPVGLLLMNPFTGWIIARLGAARTCFVSALALCLSTLLPINAPNIALMAVGLFFVGLSAALLNVAMNTSAADVEREHNILIMSSCHGMWSLGGMLGSLLAGICIALHVSPSLHMLGMTLALLLLTFALRPILKTIPAQPPTESSAAFVRPNMMLLLMIIIGLGVAMGEGAALDWSAVYLHEATGASSQIAALGFGCFSLVMTLGRFIGDALIPRIGVKRILGMGSLVAAAGLLLAISVPVPAVALTGFALLGAGCSLGAPILYKASMHVAGIPAATGLATFATFSFIGFLAGPPVIGFVAEAYGLAYGFGLVAGILLLSAVLTRKLTL